MAPGWRDDGYPREAKVHGDLPKHYVEGPQICTQAKELKPEVVKGADFVAIRQRYTFHKPGNGYKAGSTWIGNSKCRRPGVIAVVHHSSLVDRVSRMKRESPGGCFHLPGL